MKVEAPAWVAIAGTVVAILVALVKPMWDVMALHMLSINTELPVMELERKVEQVRTIDTQLRSLISSEQRIEFDSSDERIRWLRSVVQLVLKENDIKNNLAQCGTLNYYKRYKISRQAETEIKNALDLITRGEKFIPVQASSHPVQQEELTVVQTSVIVQADRLPPVVQTNSRPVQSEELPVRSTPLPGMESIYNKVLAFIHGNNHKFVSLRIWGMGGVGKTTLIKLVRDSRPLYTEDFMEVLFVQAGKGCTEVADLQKVIAVSMRLVVIDNSISQEDLIRMHLQDKSFLLLLDDLWVDFDLEKVGIPSLQRRDNQPHKRKVVLTTRSMDVNIIQKEKEKEENIIQMKCLNNEDAWNLFAGNVENAVFEDAEILGHAKEIVKACSGLPMALCAIGKFMSSKKDTREWRTTKDLLNKSKLDEITNIHEALFQRLKDSYNNLEGHMKKRFLVCSLWPENGNISMKTLTRWWKGLGLLDVSSNASDTGYTYIKNLMRLSMLEKGDTGLDSTENSHVKMHNMTRMMALWIVNERRYMDKWLPKSSYRLALSQDKWRKVEKAWVSQKDTLNWSDWSPEICFLQLKMLVAEHVFSLQLIHYFKNITFLDLEGVSQDLPDEIGTLIELQHLNLSESTITVWPTVLIKLLNLKYLYMRNNMSLQTVPEGIISTLRELQGLDLFCNGASLTNVLQELASSKRCLDMLGFTVQTIAEITKLGQLKNVCTQALCIHEIEDKSNPDIINLNFLSELRELRELAIEQSFPSQKVLVAEGDGPVYEQQLLPHLEVFELKNILKLEKVMWKNAGVDIRVVSIYKCDGLKDVTWVHHLKKLEQLTVASCKEMERLIETPELSQGQIVGGLPNVNQMVAISFPVLKKVKLKNLPNLSMISQQACKFEELSYICVTQCNEMKGTHEQEYEQMVSIHCSKGWWTENIPAFPKEPNTHLVPTFCS